MSKLLWYIYFAIYLLVETIICKTNIFFLKRKSSKEIDEYVYKRARGICNHVIKITKTKTVVKGLENIPKQPCVFVCNHQAIFDVFLLISNIEMITGFIAKKEIKSYPLIGFWIGAIHSVFMDRTNVREGMKAINEGALNVKNGYSIILFPEGTRSLKSEIAKFKKGSMKLALKANSPVVPITIDGTYRVLEAGKKVTGNVLKMTVHKPIDLENISEDDKKNLSDIIYNIINKGLGEK
jgi:1-acyl-sn-glycerol-3-phosphate acyltransferase